MSKAEQQLHAALRPSPSPIQPLSPLLVSGQDRSFSPQASVSQLPPISPQAASPRSADYESCSEWEAVPAPTAADSDVAQSLTVETLRNENISLRRRLRATRAALAQHRTSVRDARTTAAAVAAVKADFLEKYAGLRSLYTKCSLECAEFKRSNTVLAGRVSALQAALDRLSTKTPAR
jgi:hypothetical protein